MRSKHIVCWLIVLSFLQISDNYMVAKANKRMTFNDYGSLGYDGSSGTGDSDCRNNEAEKPNKQQCKIDLSCNSKLKASNIAQSAAQEAKAASDAQLSAAEAAARQVKAQLADKAFAAAKAAEAALAGKQQIVDQLEAEVREGELVVQEQGNSLQNTQGNCNAAALAAQQAELQVKMLTDAVKNAHENMKNSEQAAVGAHQDLSEKQQLVEAAKHRVEQLLRQLKEARADFKSTKQAAERAACAAHEARQRVTRERRMAEVREKLRRFRQRL